jgi:FAD/FMN-containing dehydrogenase
MEMTTSVVSQAVDGSTSEASAAPDDAASLGELVVALRALLGEDAVSTDLTAREQASVDGAPMSPILAAQLPLGLADLVVYVRDPDSVPGIIALAVRHGVPITPRGKGTGNYGQGIPLRGGMVLDMSRAARIIEVGHGFITAEAGATMIALERAARKTGQQLWMYPSTTGSSIGGFLGGGSGGTGSIAHGSNDSGFVVALDVVHGWEDPQLIHVEGEAAGGYVHAYGVTGIIVRATVRLEPAQEWSSLYASFDTFADALPVVRSLGRSEPFPRLVSADVPFVAGVLPEDPAIPKGRASLRAIIDPTTAADATAAVVAGGGRVESIREGFRGSVKLSMLSYNHPTYHLQKSDPDRYFHLEVGGEVLFDDIDAVHAVFPGSMLHIEAAHTVPIGMLNALYESPEQVYAGIERLRAIGVGVHSPHQYYVDYKVDAARDLAAVNDPAGLLNPGKLL